MGMRFQQMYLGCLAQASYYISSEGEAVVVDPRRDVDVYLAEAERDGCVIRYVIETHLHADFVSGHQELATRTGARIVYGRQAEVSFDHLAIADGEVLEIGSVRLTALETPGHTPESVCWLVQDEASPEEPVRLLTGDTLFIGDAGRPDLAGASGHTATEMAGLLYDSLHAKILPLPDEVEVFPGHGAGSACGKNISSERSSTIGVQRHSNAALQPMSREEFIAMMSRGLQPPPRYFSFDAKLNRIGVRALSDLPLEPLDASAFDEAMKAGAIILDTRESADFGRGHIAGAINIGLSGQFASWAARLLPLDQPLVLVSASDESAMESRLRLARVGMEHVMGYLAGGMESWQSSGRSLTTLTQMTAAELATSANLSILDVRNPSEYSAGHVPGAINIPLDTLPETIPDLPGPIAVICQGGYRSSAAASLLQREGMEIAANIIGGTAAWIKAGLTVESDDSMLSRQG